MKLINLFYPVTVQPILSTTSLILQFLHYTVTHN